MFLSGQLHDQILHLTLNDPSSRNAFSLQAARELRAHLVKRNFSAVVLSGSGRVFCSGGQLADYASMPTAEEGLRTNDEIRDSLEELARLECPTVAAIGGDVLGGGVELLSCFDVVVAASHVMLALWQRKIGLSFGWGGGARLEKRIGTSVLRRLSLSTIPISAHEAARLGLIDFVVQESVLTAEAVSVAKALAALPSEPVGVLKSFEATRETEDFKSLWWSDSHRAILASRKR